MKKLLFLFLSILLSFCSINPASAYEISAKQEYEFGSLYRWQMPEKTFDNYCYDHSYGSYGSPIFKILEETAQHIRWECNAENYYMSTEGFYTFSVPYVRINSQRHSETVKKEEVSRNIEDWCYIEGATGYNINEYAELLFFERTTPKKGVQVTCRNKTNGHIAQVELLYEEEPQPQIEGCTDSTAINYNPLANVHKESLCEYPPPYTPQDITASFEKSQVSIGATTWTLRFTLNVADASLDFNNIQTWNKFKAISATTNDKTITLTLRQFDDQRLDVECTNYEVTIPRRALVTPQGDTNPNPISGNFEVVGCQNFNTDPQDPNSQNEDKNNQPKHEKTIKEDNFYLSIYDTDEKGKVYLNLTNIIYFVGFLSFFSVLFFVLFGFIKNSFLGKSKKSSR